MSLYKHTHIIYLSMYLSPIYPSIYLSMYLPTYLPNRASELSIYPHTDR